MKKYYASVGHLQLHKNRRQGLYPAVLLNRKEYVLDLQEMILWWLLSWRISTMEELQTRYRTIAEKTGISSQYSMEECMRNLIQRGLVAEGSGETDADALYDLLAELYVVPLHRSHLRRLRAFTYRMLHGMPRTVARQCFNTYTPSSEEKRLLTLAEHVTMSAAEIIKCFELGIHTLSSADELMDALYCDEYTTDLGLAFEARTSPQCCQVLVILSDLFLNGQIHFERI